MKSILVTGGAGFIGSNFIRGLLRRYPDLDVHVLDVLTYAGDPENFEEDVRRDERFHFCYGNVCNPDLVSDLVQQVDTVIHFAAETHVARSVFDNATFVLTHEFWREPEESPNVTHGHHWCGNAESYFLIGDALGHAAIKLIEGRRP